MSSGWASLVLSWQRAVVLLVVVHKCTQRFLDERLRLALVGSRHGVAPGWYGRNLDRGSEPKEADTPIHNPQDTVNRGEVARDGMPPYRHL